MLNYGISTKFYNVIKSMYNNIMIAVQDGEGIYISPFFKSLIGVRQGDNLSPTLFNIFVNDLPKKFFSASCKPAYIGNIPINCMMYADDLIIISETADGLQNAMNKLNEYCETWSLTVNTTKTKCMVTKGNNKETISLKFKDTSIECVTNFNYLGLEVSHDGNNDLAKNELYKRGLKAYFKLCSTLNPRPNPSMLLHLFDHIIKPILLYGCEIWCPLDLKYRINKKNLDEKATFIKEQRDKMPFITKFMNKDDPIERLHLKFCKMSLGVHSKAPNMAVYSELGRYPLFIDQINLCMKYINYIENDTKNNLLKQVYNNLKSYNENGCSLIQLKKQLADYMTIPSGPSKIPYDKFKNNIKSNFDVYWRQMVSTTLSISGRDGGNKLRTYQLFKRNIEYETYLTLTNVEKRKAITQFRISAHKLRIETGRFNNKLKYVPPEQRLCEYCSMNKIEDEYHYLVECPLYKDNRSKLFSYIIEENKYFPVYNHTEIYMDYDL